MQNIFMIAFLDLKESFRSKWFLLYFLIFISIISTFFATGVTNSRVMGFSGLSRLLLLFIQICIIILPIFVLISTVKTILKDRDLNILEYLLSFPISYEEYYYGKAFGRMVAVFLPVFLSVVITIIWEAISGSSIPWDIFLLYTGIIFCMCFAFIGISFLISSIAKTQEVGTAIAFFIWLLMLAFLDIILIGFLMKTRVNPDIIFTIALLNPIETFRIAAISLFDPQLSVIGSTAYFILHNFGRFNFILFAHIYPIFIGLVSLLIGFYIFKNKDLA
ncbi:MAG: ABC transporter permease [Campylobacter sputorum]|uniref:ABC transporter permease n=1 Tax=Campylobacter sputorum TaxID=206 RepID=UPI000B77F826|nr:ABC transporter permease [Campylobacter sputorum]ASM38100.1 copper ABC transporter NosDFY, putative permease protein NosY [Campylobacter sputorum bv. paraureolyticus LMG 11764]MDY6121248.1 ABC transporter permease [Campylobacter sputorum]